MLVNEMRRYEDAQKARAVAERELLATQSSDRGPFGQSNLVEALQQIGYVPERQADLSHWAEALAQARQQAGGEQPRCGLCGNTIILTKTPCCDNWICDDTQAYIIFSYGRNSCYRNHMRFTLCGSHYNEGHSGDWKECEDCRKTTDLTELYVSYGTNEYNFEVLENPPDYEPTHCSECGRVIKLMEEGYTMRPRAGIICEDCSDIPF